MSKLSNPTLAMRVLNSLPKNIDAAAPFGDIRFAIDRGGWRAECPATGFGYWYRTLSQAVRSFRVTLVWENGEIVGRPFPRPVLTAVGDMRSSKTRARPLDR